MSNTRNLSRVVQRLLNQPLALHPDYAMMVAAALHGRLGIELLQGAHGQVLTQEMMVELSERGRGEARVAQERREKGKVFDTDGSVAVIPVEGELTKSWGLEPESGITGYDGIEQKLVAAQRDNDVRGIWMQIDSGGGDVAGLFPLVDLISKMSARNGGRKPIYAMAGDYAYSAAYAIASACDKVFVPETGGVGSVGVITMHADMSEAYKQRGINVTIIRSGERKAKPNSMEPIEATDLARIQMQIDRIRDMFAERVARDRGIPKSRVLKTEAVDYMGEDAKAIGFADRVANEHQAWEQLQRAISSR